MPESTDNGISLSIASLAKRPLPASQVIVGPRFDSKGEKLYFMYPKTAAELSLYCLDIGSKQLRALFNSNLINSEPTLEEQLRRERLRLNWEGLSDFELIELEGATYVLMNLGGKFILADPDDESILLDMSDSGFVSVCQAGSGDYLLGVKRDGIYRISLFGGEATALIESKDDEGITYGIAEYVAQEELDRLDGLWCSSDGQLVAFTEVDESMIPTFPIVRDNGNEVVVENYRYPLAGGDNASVRLGLYRKSLQSVEWIDLSTLRDGYLARVCFTPGLKMWIAVLNRSQDELRWYLYSPKEQTLSLVYIQKEEPWINLPSTPFTLRSGGILFTTEEMGFSHIVLLDEDGNLRKLTSGEFCVTEIVGISADEKKAFFLSTSDSPLERHLYSLDLDDLSIDKLSVEAGVNQAYMSGSGRGYVLVQNSSRERSFTATLYALDGSWIWDLPFEGVSADSLGLLPPKFIELTLEDETTLYGAVYLPSDGLTEGRPLVVATYGGPRAQTVLDSWSMTIDLQAQLLARAGVVVFKLDNRGSFNRGKAFEAQIRHGFGTVELEDQLAGIDFIIRELGVDKDRVGIYGWSYGGFMTLMAMSRAADRFAVGVAGAPVVDFALYDTAYTERYLGLPREEPESYQRTDVTRYVDGITGKLLVIHGLIDENVHFSNTTKLMASLEGLGKDVEFVVLPGSRHGPRGYRTLLEVAYRRTNFLLRGLGLRTLGIEELL
ncbi:MAG: prolyl oligopeptidase family serine peptidase [Acidimicrobiaceae bacterium]|nr:prolyl oligopeptidase family serine peptidase [Acidimicrobiaceae bacterium]